MSYEKQLFETDDGKIYYTNDFGDIFEIIEEKEDYEEKLEEIDDLKLDYKIISSKTKDLRNDLNEEKKKHGIDLTEDITSREYIKKKRRFKGTFNDIAEETRRVFKSDIIWDDDKMTGFFKKSQQKADQLRKEEELLQKEVYEELKKKEDLAEDITSQGKKKHRYYLQDRPNYKLE